MKERKKKDNKKKPQRDEKKYEEKQEENKIAVFYLFIIFTLFTISRDRIIIIFALNKRKVYSLIKIDLV